MRNMFFHVFFCMLILGWAIPLTACDLVVIQGSASASGDVIFAALWDWVSDKDFSEVTNPYTIEYSPSVTELNPSPVPLSWKDISGVETRNGYIYSHVTYGLDYDEFWHDTNLWPSPAPGWPGHPGYRPEYEYPRKDGPNVRLPANGINHFGVAIGSVTLEQTKVIKEHLSNSFPELNENPICSEGIDCDDVMRIVLERAISAAHGLQIIKDLLNDDGYGYFGKYDSAEAWVVVDRDNAYILETAGAKFWVSQKITADEFHASNDSSIAEVSLDRYKEDDYSAETEIFAEQHGWIPPTGVKRMMLWKNMFVTQLPNSSTQERINAMRLWFQVHSQHTVETVKSMLGEEGENCNLYVPAWQCTSCMVVDYRPVSNPPVPILENKVWYCLRAPWNYFYFMPFYCADSGVELSSETRIEEKDGSYSSPYWNVVTCGAEPSGTTRMYYNNRVNFLSGRYLPRVRWLYSAGDITGAKNRLTAFHIAIVDEAENYYPVPTPAP